MSGVTSRQRNFCVVHKQYQKNTNTLIIMKYNQQAMWNEWMTGESDGGERW